MLLDCDVLPVATPFMEGESGMGFVLRSGRLNGVALQHLLRSIKVQSATWLLPREIEALAQLTLVRPIELRACLRQRRLVDGRRRFEYLNHQWMSVTALRVRGLQVCPACLREDGFCRAIWELAGFCACPLHQTYLIDCCAHCRQPITWQRPAVDICRCGRFFKAMEPVRRVPPEVLDFCAWLEFRCTAGVLRSVGDRLPAWLTNVTADGAYQLLLAFGRRSHPMHQLTAAEAMSVPDPASVGEYLERGLMRSALIYERDEDIVGSVAKLVDEPLTERVAALGVSLADQATAGRALKRIRRQSPLHLLRHPWRSGPRRQGQLDLFDDADQ